MLQDSEKALNSISGGLRAPYSGFEFQMAELPTRVRGRTAGRLLPFLIAPGFFCFLGFFESGDFTRQTPILMKRILSD